MVDELAEYAALAQQQAGAVHSGFAAVPSEKGGQDIFGPYEVDADWPRDLSTLPGHEAWTFGVVNDRFADRAPA